MDNTSPIDIIVVLGGAIRQVEDGSFGTNPITKARAVAAAMLYRLNPHLKFIVSGGYNIGVRYEKTGELLQNSLFDLVSFANARQAGPSEASVLRNIMTEYGVPSSVIYLEELSGTTIENARFTTVILSRSNFVKENPLHARIGILTNLYHIVRSMSIFKAEFALQKLDLNLAAIAAEDWLFTDDTRTWSTDIETFYSQPM